MRRSAYSFVPLYFLTLAFLSTTAQAQQASRLPFWEQGRAGEAPRLTYTSDGYLRAAGAPVGTTFQARAGAGGAPEMIAIGFLGAEARWFYDGNARVSFSAIRINPGPGRDYIHLAQTVDGIPVFGARVMVQIRAGAVEFMLSDIQRDFESLNRGSLRTAPRLTPVQAQGVATAWALQAFNVPNAVATLPRLEIYSPDVVGEDGEPALAWVMDVEESTRPLRRRVLVEANNGGILFEYSLIHEALARFIFDAANTSSSGALARIEGSGPTAVAAVNEAYDYLGDTYQFYQTEHGRDSINGTGMALNATVRYCDPFSPCPYENAFWDGSRMWFGDGFQIDDVAGHELTHGVTQYESDLIYQNQSGAINESFSDMWGEWVDLTNGAGDDSPGVRWLMGEDIGAIRNMADPPAFFNPDRMGSELYYTGLFDGGGVHINSGVGNKLAYLLTDGDVFNGYTITGMGISATADLMYECQRNLLTPGSDYGDLYEALRQAGINLGLSLSQRNNLEMACRAVEIKFLAGVDNFATTTLDGVPQVNVAWNNPASPTFVEVLVRRSTTGFPVDPDADGTIVYQGTGTGFTDTSVSLSTVYYYSIWALHGTEGRSLASHGAVEPGIARLHPTERFSEYTDANDLDALMLTYTPNGPDDYTVAAQSAYSYPTNPAGGTVLTLEDDDYIPVTLGDSQTVPFYGLQWSTVYVSSNGRLLFGGASLEFEESFSTHFAIRSLAAVFDDLDPSSAGTVSWKQLADRVAFTYSGVPEFGTSLQNDFQIELFFNGTIRVTYLVVNVNDGIAGISPGGGMPLGFAETDLTDGATLIPPAPVHRAAWVATAAALLLGGTILLLRRRSARCSTR